MKVIIIGSGLIGVTTAYFLMHRGHEVTVIDRKDGPGRETSFANGALLTPSMAEPWNAPGSWRVLLRSLVRSDSAMQLRLRALPALAGWGVKFLRNSRAAIFERNTVSNLRLALYSLKVMQSLRQQTNIEYGRAASGALRIFRDAAAFDRASLAANRLLFEGLRCRRLSTAATVELEPALAPIANQLTGAIHYGTDETGDAHRFCVALSDYRPAARGVEFRFRTEVSSAGNALGPGDGGCGRPGTFCRGSIHRCSRQLQHSVAKGPRCSSAGATRQGLLCHVRSPRRSTLANYAGHRRSSARRSRATRRCHSRCGNRRIRRL